MISRPGTLLAACLCLAAVCRGDDVTAETIRITDRLPYGQSAVNYFSESVQDPVARLNAQLQARTVILAPDSRHGFLKSVLHHLAVPQASQLLVFSKTARAPELVSPATPRAVFFNDMVSVAWILDARELELSAVDPTRGVNFYTLRQPQADTPDESTAQFVRQDRCLACHAGTSSVEVPGLLLRGFQTDHTGKMLYGYSRLTHATAFDRRWGGWYVTGSPARLIHRGNLINQAENERHKDQPGFRSTLSSLAGRGDFRNWPASTSDFVAHLIFAHQVHGTNLLIRCGMECRLNRYSDAQDRLLRYLVFADEAALEIDRVETRRLLRTPYAKWFQSMKVPSGQPDALRELQLRDRVFRNRLSFLVNTPLFDGLPDEVRDRLLTRLWHGLTDDHPEKMFAHLEAAERKRIVQFLLATKAGLPSPWPAVPDP